jgi:CheY-like chemotaxis protein
VLQFLHLHIGQHFSVRAAPDQQGWRQHLRAVLEINGVLSSGTLTPNTDPNLYTLNFVVPARQTIKCPASRVTDDVNFAIQVCKKTSPDLILTNVFLHGITGHDAMKMLRESCPDIPVLMVSGLPDSDTVQDGYRPEKLQEALKTSYGNLQQAIAGLSDADLKAPVKVFGKDFTKEEAVRYILADQHEHLGQSIAYARANGVVPPWSK